MKSLLRYLLIPTFLLSLYPVDAQKTMIKWSSNLNKGQAIDVIGDFENHLYAIRYSEPSLLKLEKETLKQVEELSMKDIFSNNNILHSKINKDKIEFLVLQF